MVSELLAFVCWQKSLKVPKEDFSRRRISVVETNSDIFSYCEIFPAENTLPLP